MKSPELRPIAWMFTFAILCFVSVSIVLYHMIIPLYDFLAISLIILAVPYFISAMILGAILVYNVTSLFTNMRTDVE